MGRTNPPQNDYREPQKVAIYIRVSTDHQIDGDSLPMQRKDLVAYSELILGISDYEIFEDAGYTGKNTNRPAYQEMMARIKRREFTHLLVWKIDRISRNLLDFSEMYMELKKLRVIFVSKNESFDTSTAMGEAMLKIILVFAELERNMTSERVTATMISRASQGLWNGGRIPYGYDYDPDTETFSVREDEAEMCRMMKDDYLKNKSLTHTTKLANATGSMPRSGKEWTITTIWKMLSNPFYVGIYRYNHYKGTENRVINPEDKWIIVPNHHPAIFTLQEHETMLALMKVNKRKMNTSEQTTKRKNVHVFSGICYCEKCGSRMTATPGRLHTDGYRSTIYTCAKHRRTKDCDNPSVNDLIIGDFVINYIANIIQAKQSFSKHRTLPALQEALLQGRAFKDIEAINPEGLEAMFTLFSRFRSDTSFKLVKSRKKPPENPEVTALTKERDRQQRALKRLQDLFLYADNSMTEQDFLSRKQDITSRISAIDTKLRALYADPDNTLSDDEFIRKASYILISSKLQEAAFIYYKKLAASTSPEVLQEYVKSVISTIYLEDGHVSSIVFRNGIVHRFTWKKK